MKREFTPAADVRWMQALARGLVIGVCLAGLLVGLVWWIQRPAFSLEAIVVEGEVSRNNALTLSTNVMPRLQGNFFTVRLDEVRQAFEAVPWVRSAVVHRQFPNRLRVHLLEHQPSAVWGEEGSSQLLNAQGQVFVANVAEVEAEALPRLKGPVSVSASMLAMYRSLQPVMQGANMHIDALELSSRGHWQITTSSGARIELGRGQSQELLEQLQAFLRTLPQITARYGRTPQSLLAADLRHKNGYALRLHGVSTTEGEVKPQS